MSTRKPALVVLAVVALLFSACTPAGHGEEAGKLRDALRALPGVEEVTLDYVEPELLDQADVNLEVVMSDAATPEDVASVFEATYAGLTDEHADEEGNLTVRIGDDELELRTFESEAEAADVAEAALAGASVAGRQPRTYIHVMTQEVAAAPHVESLALVRLPHGTSSLDADRVGDEIAALYGDLAVRVDVRIRRR